LGRCSDLFVVIIPIDLPVPPSLASTFGLERHLLKVLIGDDYIPQFIGAREIPDSVLPTVYTIHTY
jgi:hypothetical protein